jgi:hypothetical protein
MTYSCKHECSNLNRKTYYRQCFHYFSLSTTWHWSHLEVIQPCILLSLLSSPNTHSQYLKGHIDHCTTYLENEWWILF